MFLQEKCDLVCRYNAEKALLQHLKEAESEDSKALETLEDWEPLKSCLAICGLPFNYYALFLKKEIA